MKYRNLRCFIIMLLPAFAASAQEQSECKIPATSERAFQQVQTYIRNLAGLVETIPQSDAMWLRSEIQKEVDQNVKLMLEPNATNRGNVVSFDALKKHRYYHAFLFQTQSMFIQERLAPLTNSALPLREQAIVLSEALSMMPNLRNNLSDYVDYDLSRKPPLLTEDNRFFIRASWLLAFDQMIDMIQCRIRAI